jgi:hypothetical protein
MAIQEVYWTLLGVERVWRSLVDKALASDNGRAGVVLLPDGGYEH